MQYEEDDPHQNCVPVKDFVEVRIFADFGDRLKNCSAKTEMLT
ncbi:hypothetical protein PN498_01685 [Oscillatoria sp. CS-180]|nr:hypothetical protein [Oscillatoria sp. CS-180]MDB9524686.1 hypothetical protein [Oscillatoria sp. CS-180]